MIEAGCWQGGSSAKWSILCKRLGYQLHIFDSFEGVEPLTPEAKASSYDFSGEYAATEGLLRSNLARYGEASVCSVHKGWFAETLALRPVQSPVRVVYIDCDLAKGTDEVLRGVVSRLVEDGWLFSQDFHIPAVQTLLCSPATWQRLGRPVPHVTRLCGNLAAVKF
jgi:O-methyltransferase